MIDKLQKLTIPFENVDLGVVYLKAAVTHAQLQDFKQSLLGSGLELLEDKRSILIEKIKAIIIEMVHSEELVMEINFSEYISAKLKYDYTHLANIFSEERGSTIERFIIMHKVERIKELIEYNELSLTEISYKLNYSSISHLSNQFKKVTGYSPSQYKLQKEQRRTDLDEL